MAQSQFLSLGLASNEMNNCRSQKELFPPLGVYSAEEQPRYRYDHTGHYSALPSHEHLAFNRHFNAITAAPTRRSRPRFLTLTSLPRAPSPAPFLEPVVTRRKPWPFLRLPTEIRLKIYALLVLPQSPEHMRPSYAKISASAQDYYNHKDQDFSSELPAVYRQTLMIRTINPQHYNASHLAMHRHARKSYIVRADRLRSRCLETTYHCVNNPRLEDNLAIMRTNTRIHAEVAELLYGSYTFDFDTHVEAIIPFLSDLTPYARSCIKSVRVVKRALPHDKAFDKCEWSNAMRYLSTRGNNIRLRHLQLGIVAGRPGRTGWDRTPKHSAQDFGMLVHTEGMEWMQYLLEIRGLETLDVQAIVEHCPPSSSSAAMANYVRFSASVESGFTDFLRTKLLAEPLTCRL